MAIDKIKGISSSKLVSNLYEEKKENVPVGKTILTNNPDELPKHAKPLSLGQDITRLHIDQFDAFVNDEKVLKRLDSTETIIYEDQPSGNSGLIVEAAFSVDNGILNLVKANSELVQIDGFLKQSDFGRGNPGAVGDPGDEGEDAHDGDDGKEGDEGCAGSLGPVGEIGKVGKTGADGPVGVAGPPGQTGPTGIQGDPGPDGKIGQEGSRGPRGSRCAGGGAGPAGADGVSPNPNVVISTETPDSTAVLWGIPE